ncbi:Mucolipidin [Phytophthora cinnamomi]|uniref:Mucolipidin n=1 Tax=Phytophthora cinnamomi TaxID=4785 RepID=UPI0035596CDD|nr:Mucolipidin [Phytophthora cinnamomi]
MLEPLRLALHVGAALLLSARCSQLGAALHPFQRAVANDWVRLLFYVDASRSGGAAVVTLPHFLLEVEEEIAANTREHLHGAAANYFRLADVALDSYLVFGNDSELLLPPRCSQCGPTWGEETWDKEYKITNASASEQWPVPLRMGESAARQPETREFFDRLDAMELKLVVGMKRKERQGGTEVAGSEKLYEWTVVMRYDLLNQGHLEVTMNYDLVHVPLLAGKRAASEGERICRRCWWTRA